MRIAITTTDGKKVNQHFGKATRFSIYDWENGKLKMVDLREVQSYCECENDKPLDLNHKFLKDRFTRVANQLNDCKILYTKQIGDKPKKQLENRGVEVKLCACSIEMIPVCTGNCSK